MRWIAIIFLIFAGFTQCSRTSTLEKDVSRLSRKVNESTRKIEYKIEDEKVRLQRDIKEVKYQIFELEAKINE